MIISGQDAGGSQRLLVPGVSRFLVLVQCQCAEEEQMIQQLTTIVHKNQS